MTLEDRIVAWSNERPAWQRKVMIKVAAGENFSDEDYDELIRDMLSPNSKTNISFGLEHFPKAMDETPSVRLKSIDRTEHVNALKSDQPLTFGLNGITIIYGDNGSGKSGYARLLKHITRARHEEEILSDVFRDEAAEKPTAKLQIYVGENVKEIIWPDSTRPELKNMLFYDSACGEAYVSRDSDFPYRPLALRVMDGLIAVCVNVRNRIDVELSKNDQTKIALPAVADEVRDTEVGRFLSQLSGNTAIETLDSLVAKFDQSSTTINDLQEQEVLLRSKNINEESQRFVRQAKKIDSLGDHIRNLHLVLGDEPLRKIQQDRDNIKNFYESIELLSKEFATEPLSGIGDSPWKALWESARRFSEENAYPGRLFPVVEESGLCVLCLQPLGSESRNRLLKFENFVKDDIQAQLKEVSQSYDYQVEKLSNLDILSAIVTSDLEDIESVHISLVSGIRMLLQTYENAKQQTLDALADKKEISLFGINPSSTLTQITRVAKQVREKAEALGDPQIVQQQLAKVVIWRKEFELLQQIKNSREEIIKEIKRQREYAVLEKAKADAATTLITKKVSEFSEEGITDTIRKKFTQEIEKLYLKKITITRTRAERGLLFYQPELDGARQGVKLPRVFSEGEQTALSLAAFFTETLLDDSKSAIILDDPVNSLDHKLRYRVAARLANFAQDRQVVVFTHDVAFVADIKRESGALGVSVAERSVTRNRIGPESPGECIDKLPWKIKDVRERFTELERDLAQIKKDNTLDEREREDKVTLWAGRLSETWECIFSQEIVGPILAEGGLEVRPKLVKIIAHFSEEDYKQFDASYSRVSQWVPRHYKSPFSNPVTPDVEDLEKELDYMKEWYNRVKGYKNL